MFLLKYFLHLYNIPMPLATFPLMYCTRAAKVKKGSIITPKNLVFSVIEIVTPSMIKSVSSNIFALRRRNSMKWVFLRLSDNLFILSQSTTFAISVFIVLIRALGFFPERNRLESSANSKKKILLDTWARSFIYNKNSNGPSIDPCGTPHVMVRWLEQTLWYSTNCCRPHR